MYTKNQKIELDYANFIYIPWSFLKKFNNEIEMIKIPYFL